MARLPSCPDCGVDIVDKDRAKKTGGRWVCEDFQAIRATQEEDRQELYAYVAELFNIAFPTGGMLRQIKNYREEYDYTYKGMTLSLEYWNDTLGNSMANAKGVGIIPFIYEDAKNFYIQRMQLANSNECVKQTKRVVKITKDNTNTENKHAKLIDMNDL